MKFAIAALAGLAVASAAADPNPALRLEPDGVRVGSDLVTGPALRVVDSVLVSGTAVEPLSREIAVFVAENRSLVLEPGVRLRLDGAGALKLVAHAGRPLAIRGALIAAPASLAVDAGGWIVEGRRFEGTELRVALAASSSTGPAIGANVPAAPPTSRRSFKDNPRTLPEGAEGHVLRFLSKVSPSGF